MGNDKAKLPFSVDYGDPLGRITFESMEDLIAFARHTIPDYFTKQELAEIKAQESEDDTAIMKFQSRIESGGGVHYSGERRKPRKNVPTRVGKLWDEDMSLLIDEDCEFELSFPKGRFVTGFVGIMRPSREIPVPKRSLLWHDYLIDIPDNRFWKGRVMVQRRTEDGSFNIRSHGMNEYVV